MNIRASNLISRQQWDGLKCGETITDYDDKVWEVAYIDHSALRGEVHIAPKGARSGAEVCVCLQDGKIFVLYGKKANSLMGPTSAANRQMVQLAT